MSTRTKWFNLLASLVLGILFICNSSANAAASVSLYTPYTKISVPPGESISYNIEVINNGSEIKNVPISVVGLQKGWDHDMKSGGWNIQEMSILPGDKKNFSLHVAVPLKINKGTYRFYVVAKGYVSLPLTVIVSKEGTYKTEFTTKQANMEGAASSKFTFTATLKNSTADKQQYALMANAPRGWNVTFKVNYKEVTSADIEANSSADITIEIDPPDQVAAGKYKIPVRAATSTTSANLELEAVITGSYNMELTTPTGLLSTDITAGDQKRVELVVRNTGSAALNDIKLSFTAPSNWDVVFDPKQVDKLEPGKIAQVFATIKADKKAIAGDYVTNLEAKTPEVTSKASFRMSVETSMLWGWVGVLIILVALGSVYSLFRKYGRR